MAFWSSLFCKPICPLLPSTAHIDVSGKCSPLMRRHPIGGIYSWHYFPCTSDLPVFKNFSFFSFLSPLLPSFPPSFPPSCRSRSFSLSLIRGSRVANIWHHFCGLHLSGGGCLRPDHSIPLPDSGLALCCGHQTCKEHSFLKHPGKCGLRLFQRNFRSICIKRSLSSRDHGPENWDYPILTYTFSDFTGSVKMA